MLNLLGNLRDVICEHKCKNPRKGVDSYEVLDYTRKTRKDKGFVWPFIWINNRIYKRWLTVGFGGVFYPV